MPDDARDTEGPRSAARFIEQLNYGECHTELSDKLFELGRQIRKLQIDRGGKLKGELVLSLKFATDGDGPCIVTYDVKSKPPATPKTGSVFWITRAGNMTREDPKQQSLPGIREVELKRAVFGIEDDEQEPREVTP